MRHPPCAGGGADGWQANQRLHHEQWSPQDQVRLPHRPILCVLCWGICMLCASAVQYLASTQKPLAAVPPQLEWLFGGCVAWKALRAVDSCLCSTPIEWETPNSQTARVNLQLQFSAFFGYGQADAQQGYLGLQCHGLLWPVMDSDLPHYWPIAPPVVSGKVRIMVSASHIPCGPLPGLWVTPCSPTSVRWCAGASVCLSRLAGKADTWVVPYMNYHRCSGHNGTYGAAS